MNIATYLKVKRNKLFEKIDEFENGSVIEFHRYTPLKSPTIVITGACDRLMSENQPEKGEVRHQDKRSCTVP